MFRQNAVIPDTIRMSIASYEHNLKLVSHFLQTTFQILATLHQVLHIVDVWKEHFHQVKELRLIRR